MANQEFELTTKLRIRTAAVNDAQSLEQYCFTGRTTAEIDQELQDDLSRMQKGEVYRIVAEASGHAIGNIRLERHPLNPEIGDVSQLAVSAPFRQFAVADKLIDFTEQVAQENGITTLQIELSRSEEPIINAYKDWGFDERPVVTLQKQSALLIRRVRPTKKRLQMNPLHWKPQKKTLNRKKPLKIRRIPMAENNSKNYCKHL